MALRCDCPERRQRQPLWTREAALSGYVEIGNRAAASGDGDAGGTRSSGRLALYRNFTARNKVDSAFRQLHFFRDGVVLEVRLCQTHRSRLTDQPTSPF